MGMDERLNDRSESFSLSVATQLRGMVAEGGQTEFGFAVAQQLHGKEWVNDGGGGKWLT